MPKLVRKDVAQHEPPERVTRPGDDPVLVGAGARREKPRTLIRRELEPKPPRRWGLVVEHDSPRTDEPPEWELCAYHRSWDELHTHQAVLELFAESLQSAPDV